MAALFSAVALVDRTEPAMLFFGLPWWMGFLPWLARAALPAALLLAVGLPAIFRDAGMTPRSRFFFTVLAAVQVLFFLSMAGLKLI